jgi:predicted  nucleic acid-binding Zn-ribbon protein
MAREQKKDLSEMSVADKLQNLYKLQTTLSAIDEKKAIRGELPLEVQDLEDEIEGLSHRVEKIQNEISGLEKNISTWKGEIVTAQNAIERFKVQLEQVRNNREYDNLTKEIEFQELEVELRNKRIREANEAMRAKYDDIHQIVEVLGDRRMDLEVKRSELEEIVAETKNEEERLRDEAKQLELRIEPRLLTAFKRIRKNSRNGLGIVYVQRDACGGCFNKIPPQRQLDIRMSKKIIVCEYCGRIMIDPVLAGVNMRPVEEEKAERHPSSFTTSPSCPLPACLPR